MSSTPCKAFGPGFMPAYHRPWFRYFAPVDEGGAQQSNDDGSGDGAGDGAGDGSGGEKPAEKPDEDLGFPKDTPIEQMTPEQKADYWKHQSKVQQKKVDKYEKHGTPDDVKKAFDDLAVSRREGLTDHEKAIEDARKEGETVGAATAAQKHLRIAVEGLLIGATRGTSESFEDADKRVKGALEFADLTKFVTGDGELDAEKVQTFAKSIGSADSDSNGSGSYPLFEAMQRQSLPAPGSTGSVDQYEQATYDRLKSN